MHERIVQIKKMIEAGGFTTPFAIDLLVYLKSKGVTATEAAITLSQAYSLTPEEADRLVYPSGIWPPEPVQDVAYQVFLYVYGGKENEDKTKITVDLNLNKKKRRNKFIEGINWIRWRLGKFWGLYLWYLLLQSS